MAFCEIASVTFLTIAGKTKKIYLVFLIYNLFSLFSKLFNEFNLVLIGSLFSDC